MATFQGCISVHCQGANHPDSVPRGLSSVMPMTRAQGGYVFHGIIVDQLRYAAIERGQNQQSFGRIEVAILVRVEVLLNSALDIPKPTTVDAWAHNGPELQWIRSSMKVTGS